MNIRENRADIVCPVEKKRRNYDERYNDDRINLFQFHSPPNDIATSGVVQEDINSFLYRRYPFAFARIFYNGVCNYQGNAPEAVYDRKTRY